MPLLLDVPTTGLGWKVVAAFVVVLLSTSSTISSNSNGNGGVVLMADAFAIKEAARSGGRQPSQPDRIDPAVSDSSQTSYWEPDPMQDGECRLILCQITDVYTLENFASFKTMMQETKHKADGATVLSVLTGDFLRYVGLTTPI